MADNNRRPFHTVLHILGAGALFLFGGIIIHTLVMFVDYHFISETLHLKLHEDFVGNIFSAPMVPMMGTYGIFSILLFFSWHRTKKALLFAHRKEVENEKMELVVKFMQRLTGILAEHITTHNVEILNWVESRKKNEQTVPEMVETPAKNIAKALQSLSALSFVSPYTGDRPKDIEDIERVLKDKLNGMT